MSKTKKGISFYFITDNTLGLFALQWCSAGIDNMASWNIFWKLIFKYMAEIKKGVDTHQIYWNLT